MTRLVILCLLVSDGVTRTGALALLPSIELFVGASFREVSVVESIPLLTLQVVSWLRLVHIETRLRRMLQGCRPEIDLTWCRWLSRLLTHFPSLWHDCALDLRATSRVEALLKLLPAMSVVMFVGSRTPNVVRLRPTPDYILLPLPMLLPSLITMQYTLPREAEAAPECPILPQATRNRLSGPVSRLLILLSAVFGQMFIIMFRWTAHLGNLRPGTRISLQTLKMNR